MAIKDFTLIPVDIPQPGMAVTADMLEGLNITEEQPDPMEIPPHVVITDPPSEPDPEEWNSDINIDSDGELDPINLAATSSEIIESLEVLLRMQTDTTTPIPLSLPVVPAANPEPETVDSMIIDLPIQESCAGIRTPTMMLESPYIASSPFLPNVDFEIPAIPEPKTPPKSMGCQTNPDVCFFTAEELIELKGGTNICTQTIITDFPRKPVCKVKGIPRAQPQDNNPEPSTSDPENSEPIDLTIE